MCDSRWPGRPAACVRLQSSQERSALKQAVTESGPSRPDPARPSSPAVWVNSPLRAKKHTENINTQLITSIKGTVHIIRHHSSSNIHEFLSTSQVTIIYLALVTMQIV